MAVNKVVKNSQTLLDLTGDAISEENVAKGVQFHKANGEITTGTLNHTDYAEYVFYNGNPTVRMSINGKKESQGVPATMSQYIEGLSMGDQIRIPAGYFPNGLFITFS